MTTDLTLKVLNRAQVNEQWSDIEPFLKNSLDYSPDTKYEDIIVPCQSGQWIVVLAYRETELVGAVAIKFRMSRQEKIAVVVAMGGNWICTQQGMDSLRDILRKTGAVKMQGIARFSVARMWQRLGVKPLYTVMETDI